MNTTRKHALPLPCAISALLVLAVVFVALPAGAQAGADPKTVPVIDGGIGPCSVDFTVTGPNGAPVYDAKIRVHIAYGFGSFHKLDLQVGTNAGGKARFEGLPEKLKRGLNFHASHEDLEGSAFVDPAATCKAQLTIVLQKATRKPE